MPISFAGWEAYPWKNELKLQAERAVKHGREFCHDDFASPHDPHAMLQRALVLAAFCLRRMIETRLVTDAYAASALNIRSLPSRSGSVFRKPFRGSSGGDVFENYAFDGPLMIKLKPGELANEIIHSSQLMVVTGEVLPHDGFLVASDRHQTRRLLHLSFLEYVSFTEAALNDRVTFASDQWDPQTGQIIAVRR